ncbi:hypothetical protein ACR78H_16680 [Sphingobacterium siyangense]|uniref:hypothetical protein n=1 Tax=Sphingobacterium siyangense TaxID=459529 RepID=UPI003DA51C19
MKRHKEAVRRLDLSALHYLFLVGNVHLRIRGLRLADSHPSAYFPADQEDGICVASIALRPESKW